MKVDEIETGGGGDSVEHRLEAAERLCGLLRERVDALEREREALRARLEGILSLLDGIAGP